MSELTVQATMENIRTVTDFINAKLREQNWPEGSRIQIDVAIDEIFGNIVQYAYKGREPGTVTVLTSIDGVPKCTTITFIDDGRPYDPRQVEDPDTTLAAADREIGGLGLFMVKNIMDSMDYEFKDGKNMLTIKKAI